jgi:hypothetical protein
MFTVRLARRAVARAAPGLARPPRPISSSGKRAYGPVDGSACHDLIRSQSESSIHLAHRHPPVYNRPTARHAMTTCSCGPVRDVVSRGDGAGCVGGGGVTARDRRRMNALATHVGDGRWVVETPRPVAEVDKVVTVPSPSMMSVAGTGPMQPMAAVWPQDGAWVAPFPGSAPGVVTWQGVGAPFMQVPSEPWFEGAGELAEVPEADDHGGCGTNEVFERAHESRRLVFLSRGGTPEYVSTACRRPGRYR